MRADRRIILAAIFSMAGIGSLSGVPASAGSAKARRRRFRAKRRARSNVVRCIRRVPSNSACFETDLACCRKLRNPDFGKAWKSFCACLEATSCSFCGAPRR